MTATPDPPSVGIASSGYFLSLIVEQLHMFRLCSRQIDMASSGSFVFWGIGLYDQPDFIAYALLPFSPRFLYGIELEG
jgi:hypothetical protein